MVNFKDIDKKVLLPGCLLTLIGGVALGAFVVRPQMDKVKEKRNLAIKTGDNKSKEG